jgi:hypothetical protein
MISLGDGTAYEYFRCGGDRSLTAWAVITGNAEQTH